MNFIEGAFLFILGLIFVFKHKQLGRSDVEHQQRIENRICIFKKKDISSGYNLVFAQYMRFLFGVFFIIVSVLIFIGVIKF